jgi:Troponin I residues 1-32
VRCFANPRSNAVRTSCHRPLPGNRPALQTGENGKLPFITDQFPQVGTFRCPRRGNLQGLLSRPHRQGLIRSKAMQRASNCRSPRPSAPVSRFSSACYRAYLTLLTPTKNAARPIKPANTELTRGYEATLWKDLIERLLSEPLSEFPFGNADRLDESRHSALRIIATAFGSRDKLKRIFVRVSATSRWLSPFQGSSSPCRCVAGFNRDAVADRCDVQFIGGLSKWVGGVGGRR